MLERNNERGNKRETEETKKRRKRESAQMSVLEWGRGLEKGGHSCGPHLLDEDMCELRQLFKI